ncbi:biotin--[acetyl-CoA-carboxylase] ligase [Terrisporobacter mayombei]|uniref:Bifunctional ligase/repressor BirA n=1 Tax=Terrisporobacter mayombei TaxID=1541 RepID=A0ABY9Q4J7_9FIRM|nr:biotin--[acetyl-CoA-carboxylase] ligase [Terrisporobacter mayombei]MCC3870081.1 biotin--[acetyl-CoA-carboxylase] ligase [Terrisporobacter mayombei]WMT82423.1 Bifunctional ligase/repressor BirA [Terrisporobacter mayombei]
MRDKIIEVILDSGTDFVSGEELSKKLGISRTAIWKHINILREEGYDIESVNRKGYRLIGSPKDLLNPQNIYHNLKTEFIGKNVIHLESVDSTNDYLKKVGDDVQEGTVVISEEQTKGKGRLGRNWQSKSKEGIWMSIILKPEIIPYKAPFITLIAGAAIVKALNNLQVSANIKWPNDIIINNKKVSGILTELSAEIERINYVVVGIGMNVKNLDFDKELEEKATSLYKEDYHLSRVEIVSQVLYEFEKLYNDYIKNDYKEETLKICKEYSAILNKDVYIIKGDEKELVKCIDISDDGNLIVRAGNNNVQEILSGEVSIRGVKGYV